MNLRATSIADRGDLRKERLVIKVDADGDVGQFAVFRTLRRGSEITNGVTSTYWFPNQSVKRGDLVVLYTKAGQYTQRLRENGSTVHFFYWNQDSVNWADRDYAPVLVHTANWQVLDAP